MSNAEINCKFKELLTQLHKELFKPRGYSKSNQDFLSYSKGNLGKYINFQKSRFNSKDIFRFTVNVEVFLVNEEPPKHKYDRQFVFGERIGHFSNNYNCDQWWCFNSDNYDDIYNELKSVFLNDIFPILDKLECKKDLIILYKSEKFDWRFWSQQFEKEIKLLEN